tara:strand:- start:7798 stop:7998 length:201 start_codon:yes stop_codon:yes gene_type:complete
MIETMIEEVQDLHVAIHNESISQREILKKYNCKMTINDLEKLINALTILHMRNYYPLFGAPNFNEL